MRSNSIYKTINRPLVLLLFGFLALNMSWEDRINSSGMDLAAKDGGEVNSPISNYQKLDEVKGKNRKSRKHPHATVEESAILSFDYKTEKMKKSITLTAEVFLFKRTEGGKDYTSTEVFLVDESIKQIEKHLGTSVKEDSEGGVCLDCYLDGIAEEFKTVDKLGNSIDDIRKFANASLENIIRKAIVKDLKNKEVVIKEKDEENSDEANKLKIQKYFCEVEDDAKVNETPWKKLTKDAKKECLANLVVKLFEKLPEEDDEDVYVPVDKKHGGKKLTKSLIDKYLGPLDSHLSKCLRNEKKRDDSNCTDLADILTEGLINDDSDKDKEYFDKKGHRIAFYKDDGESKIEDKKLEKELASLESQCKASQQRSRSGNISFDGTNNLNRCFSRVSQLQQNYQMRKSGLYPGTPEYNMRQMEMDPSLGFSSFMLSEGSDTAFFDSRLNERFLSILDPGGLGGRSGLCSSFSSSDYLGYSGGSCGPLGNSPYGTRGGPLYGARINPYQQRPPMLGGRPPLVGPGYPGVQGYGLQGGLGAQGYLGGRPPIGGRGYLGGRPPIMGRVPMGGAYPNQYGSPFAPAGYRTPYGGRPYAGGAISGRIGINAGIGGNIGVGTPPYFPNARQGYPGTQPFRF